MVVAISLLKVVGFLAAIPQKHALKNKIKLFRLKLYDSIYNSLAILKTPFKDCLNVKDPLRPKRVPRVVKEYSMTSLSMLKMNVSLEDEE